jgi:hypothetical protein
MATDFTPFTPNNFTCNSCSITCNKLSDWKRHIQTKKHIGNKTGENSNNLATTSTPLACECGKIYTDRTGLWRHKKKCADNSSNDKDNSVVDANLIVQLIKQNQEFKDLLVEQNTKMIDAFSEAIKHNATITNNINSNNNSNNKTFNLNLFLYEDCKDAMDMSEFLESIKIQLADVMSVGELGYVDGISKLIIQNLKALDVTKRPVHCTDEKREVIYIKEAGVWTKDEDNSKLRRLIKTVSNRNFKHTRLYKEKYPDCVHPHSKYSDIYVKLVLEATGGGSKYNDYDSENKIMKKIAKEITIDKSEFLTNA